jgi:AbrB family looped-hinge helix DNA binding protein
MTKNRYIGVCRVGEKGQIVIPKEARAMFGINPGDTLVVLCDKKRGMAIVKSDTLDDVTSKILDGKKNDQG